VWNAQGPFEIAFDTSFDENGIAVLDAHLMTVFDPETLEFSFGLKGSVTARYLRLADPVLFGLDAQGRLAEVRLAVPTTAWWPRSL
jgi:hypothetical protein